MIQRTTMWSDLSPMHPEGQQQTAVGIREKEGEPGSSRCLCAVRTDRACQLSISKDQEGTDCNWLNSELY